MQDLEAAITADTLAFTEQMQFTEAEDQEVDSVKQQLEQIRQDIVEREKQGHAAKSAQDHFFKQKEQIQRKIMHLQNALDTAEASAARVLQDAMLESVELPGSSTQEKLHGIDVPMCFRFEFSELPDSLTKASTDTRQKNLDQLRKELEQLKSDIDGMAPNLKAPKEYEQVLREESDLKMVVPYICCALS